MYIPKQFNVEDQETIIRFVKENSFGILFTDGKDLTASHIPFVLQEGENGNTLIGHMAKANSQWTSLQKRNVLVVFPGPHAYISPTWYGEEMTVPTWNYVAVHIYGEFEIINTVEGIKEILKISTGYYEKNMTNPWEVPFNDKYIKGLMNGIVGFKIHVNKMEGKWKLSQNHSNQRQRNLINGLRESNDYNSQEIANLLEQNLMEKRG